MISSKPNIAVFFGGDAENFDLSEESGYWACQYIPRSTYHITPVRILPNGQWQVPLGNLPDQGPVKQMLVNIFAAVPEVSAVKGLERLFLRPIRAIMTFLRGHGGDDGALHGFGNTLSIPLVGSSLSACQQTSDKIVCAERVHDIMASPTALRFNRNDPVDKIVERVRQTFVPPLFVKPVYQEASIGVEEVTSLDELTAAVHHARRAGDIMVQEKSKGSEMSITLYNDIQGKVHTLPPTMIIPLRATFYDQAAKRRPGRVTLNTAADHSVAFHPIQEKAKAMYQELGLNGIISFDLSVSPNKPELLEINTVPTLSRLTPLIQQLKAEGLNPTQLLDQQIRQTLA